MSEETRIDSRAVRPESERAREWLDELSLLRQVADGDKEAFEQLYHAYYPRLFSYLFRLLRRLDAVEETLNDVMMVVWRTAANFREQSRVSTWVFGIAYRQALKSRRKARRHPDLLPLESIDGPRGAGPDEVSQREWSLALSAALARLSPEHRAVVELTYHYGYSYLEIGEIVGCPVNTVKTRMFHARRRLQRMLNESPAARSEGS